MPRYGDQLRALLQLQDEQQRNMLQELNSLRARSGGRSLAQLSDFSGVTESTAAQELVRELNEFGAQADLFQSWIRTGTSQIDAGKIQLPFSVIYSSVLEEDKASLTIQIPSIYNHLIIMGQARSTEVTYAVPLAIRYNDDDTANYREQYHGGQGGGASIGAFTTNTFITVADLNGTSAPSGSSGVFFAVLPHIQGGFWKTFLSFRDITYVNATQDLNIFLGGARKDTSRVQTLTFYCVAGNILAGSIISVYGIR